MSCFDKLPVCRWDSAKITSISLMTSRYFSPTLLVLVLVYITIFFFLLFSPFGTVQFPPYLFLFSHHLFLIILPRRGTRRDWVTESIRLSRGVRVKGMWEVRSASQPSLVPDRTHGSQTRRTCTSEFWRFGRRLIISAAKFCDTHLLYPTFTVRSSFCIFIVVFYSLHKVGL